MVADGPVAVVPEGGVEYTQEEKLRGAMAWLAWADGKKAAEYAGVTEAVIRGWMESDWWSSALDMARFKQGEKLDARLSEIIRRSTDQVLERLELGDERIGRDGELVRVRVAARDLAVIAAVAMDKRQILRGQPTTISRNESELSGIAEKLKQLGMQRQSVQQIGITVEGEVVAVGEKPA